jgi:hypothetical protein
MREDRRRGRIDLAKPSHARARIMFGGAVGGTSEHVFASSTNKRRAP